MITITSDHIKIEVHRGTWYVIDEGYFVLNPTAEHDAEATIAHFFLLEHEQYGDEAPSLIVDLTGQVIADEVSDGFDSLEDAGWVKCEALNKRYFYTFGSDEKFPYQNGWVEVHAAGWNEAHAKFRARFPDRSHNCLNCAFFYDEVKWHQMDPEHTWHGYHCYEVIE